MRRRIHVKEARHVWYFTGSLLASPANSGAETLNNYQLQTQKAFSGSQFQGLKKLIDFDANFEGLKEMSNCKLVVMAATNGKTF